MALFFFLFLGEFFHTSFIYTLEFSIFGNKPFFGFFILFRHFLLFFIVTINVLNHRLVDRLFSSWHISLVAVELVLVFILSLGSIMFTNRTSGDGLELVPVIHNLIATGPAFLQVVENGFSRMEVTGFGAIFALEKFLLASIAFTLELFHGLMIYSIIFNLLIIYSRYVI